MLPQLHAAFADATTAAEADAAAALPIFIPSRTPASF